ncbi:MAG: hypothetical protein JXD23_01950 [Spirochaetales bacterium]|nr:hypothetical protein [Spirochaetales bacterium]
MNEATKPDGGDERRLDDIQTIKEVLLRVSKKHLVEPYSYCVWGIVSILGGIAHSIIAMTVNHPAFNYFLFVWIPVFAVGGFFEAVGFVRRMAREALPLTSKTALWLMLAFAGVCLAFAVIVIIFVRFHAEAFLPVLVSLFVGISLIGYALLSCPSIFAQAYFVMLGGVVNFIFQIPAPYSVLVTSCSIGTAFIWAGWAAWIKDGK